MSDESDAFEQDLVVRLGARADSVTGGEVPLPGLRAAGVRRARRRVAVQGTATLAVLAVAAGAVTQLGHDGGRATVAVGAAGSPGAPVPGTTQMTAKNLPDGQLPTGPRPPVVPDDVSQGIHSNCEPADPVGWGLDNFANYQGYRVIRLKTDPPGHAVDPVFHPKQVEHDLVKAVEDLGTKQYQGQYLGFCWDQGASTVYVNRVPGASGFDDAVRAAAKASEDTKVVFRDASHTYAELKALSAKVEADVGHWKSKGLTLMHWKIVPDGSGLMIQYIGAAEGQEVTAEFQQKYGPLVVGSIKYRS